MPTQSEWYKHLVDRFRRELAPGLEQYLNHYRAMSRDQLVREAVRSRRPDGKMHGHQCRPGGARMDKLARDVEPATELFCAATSFDELYNLISRFRQYMIAELVFYDVSLRVGAGRSLLPQEVYMQCGAEEGARKILGAAAVRGKRSLPLSAFPPELRVLKPYELENFLCHYRNMLDPNGPPPSRGRRNSHC